MACHDQLITENYAIYNESDCCLLPWRRCRILPFTFRFTRHFAGCTNTLQFSKMFLIRSADYAEFSSITMATSCPRTASPYAPRPDDGGPLPGNFSVGRPIAHH